MGSNQDFDVVRWDRSLWLAVVLIVAGTIGVTCCIVAAVASSTPVYLIGAAGAAVALGSGIARLRARPRDRS